MMKVNILGTSGMQPLLKRGLASALITTEKTSILIDAGEGTQIALRMCGSLVKKIGYILITHLHLDHVGGIPGILQAIANTGRKETVTFIGPVGLRNKVNAALEFIAALPYEIQILELNSNNLKTIQAGSVLIHPFICKHSITCYGFTIEEKRNRKFLNEKAIAFDVPREDYNKILNNRPIFVNGKKYRPEMFLGPERKGIKVTYCTDTRPSYKIMEAARNVDLFICEGMYPDKKFEDNARKYKHMLATEAAELAVQANVGELWLTHFSPMNVHPEDYIDSYREIFPNTIVGYGGLCKELVFRDDE